MTPSVDSARTLEDTRVTNGPIDMPIKPTGQDRPGGRVKGGPRVMRPTSRMEWLLCFTTVIGIAVLLGSVCLLLLLN